jgi:hypothetical protein
MGIAPRLSSQTRQGEPHYCFPQSTGLAPGTESQTALVGVALHGSFAVSRAAWTALAEVLSACRGTRLSTPSPATAEVPVCRGKEVELAGFEPPTSWVRFRLLSPSNSGSDRAPGGTNGLLLRNSWPCPLRVKPAGSPKWESDYPRICGDCRRFRHKSVFVPDSGHRGYNSPRVSIYEARPISLEVRVSGRETCPIRG